MSGCINKHPESLIREQRISRSIAKWDCLSLVLPDIVAGWYIVSMAILEISGRTQYIYKRGQSTGQDL